MRFLIVGANGMLAQEFKSYFHLQSLEYAALTHSQCDITDFQQLFDCVSAFQPHVLINGAAYTQVDRCETDQELAYNVNAYGAENCAKVAHELGCVLVHFSTDYVFDGQKKGAYHEQDKPNPLSYYGLTKLDSERLIQHYCLTYYIFRIQWVYGVFGSHFVSTIQSLNQTKEKIQVVHDQCGTPTWTLSIVEQVLKAVQLKIPFGVYHLRDSGETTWFDYATYLCQRLSLPLIVEPIDSSEYQRPARRPLNGCLDHTKLCETIDFIPKYWQDQIDLFIRS